MRSLARPLLQTIITTANGVRRIEEIRLGPSDANCPLKNCPVGLCAGFFSAFYEKGLFAGTCINSHDNLGIYPRHYDAH
jgi:hypothetical protein